MGPTDSEPLCWVIDTVVRPRATVSVRSLEELRQLLWGDVAHQYPRVVEVHLPGSTLVSVGLGGDLATVVVHPPPESPRGREQPCWMARARVLRTTEPREFSYERIPEWIEASALMSPEEAIGIVLDIVRLGDLPDSHVWGPPGPIIHPQADSPQAGHDARLGKYEPPDDFTF